MKLVNQLLNYKFHNYEYLSLILFVILPVSFIFGNAFINLNIVLLNLLALFYCFKFKYWKWLKKDIFLYLIIFYAYLLLNSIYAHFFKFYEYNDGLLRSLFFIKFILLVLSFQTFLKNKIILSLVYKSWFLIISIFIFDVLLIPSGNSFISSGLFISNSKVRGSATIQTDIPIQNNAIRQSPLLAFINSCANNGNKPIPNEWETPRIEDALPLNLINHCATTVVGPIWSGAWKINLPVPNNR